MAGRGVSRRAAVRALPWKLFARAADPNLREGAELDKRGGADVLGVDGLRPLARRAALDAFDDIDDVLGEPGRAAGLGLPRRAHGRDARAAKAASSQPALALNADGRLDLEATLELCGCVVVVVRQPSELERYSIEGGSAVSCAWPESGEE